MAFMKDGLVKDGELSLKSGPDLTVQGIEAGRQTYISTNYIGVIQNMPGVKQVTPRIWGYGNIGNTLIVIVGVELRTIGTNDDGGLPRHRFTLLGWNIVARRSGI
jgi:hypothetical protein